MEHEKQNIFGLNCYRGSCKYQVPMQIFAVRWVPPNELLTNNSKVQDDQQFTDINHKSKTGHYYSMPHCQNQN
eukprot:11572443-Ditylum_brightwellii.AAC.1